MLHVYYGNGKGKTTAATGLVVRAIGAGMRPAVVQFLKDGSSGEVSVLRNLLAVSVAANTPPVRFSFAMDETERAAVRRENDTNLTGHLERLEAGTLDLLVLDEALDAVATDLLEEALLQRAAKLAAGRPEGPELVITGHELPAWLAQRADYLTCMTAERHPYEQGVAAREGIEY